MSVKCLEPTRSFIQHDDLEHLWVPGTGGAVVSWGSEPARKTECQRATQTSTGQAVVCAPKGSAGSCGAGSKLGAREGL